MELMNENKKPMTVYMVLLFEFLPKTTPGYKPASLVLPFAREPAFAKVFRFGLM
jgi:hypothetical protein